MFWRGFICGVQLSLLVIAALAALAMIAACCVVGGLAYLALCTALAMVGIAGCIWAGTVRFADEAPRKTHGKDHN